MTTKKYGLVNHEIKSCLPFPAEHESPLTRRTEIRSQSTVTLHGGCCLNRVHVTPLREKYHKMIHVSLVHSVYHQNKQKVVTGLGGTTTTQKIEKHSQRTPQSSRFYNLSASSSSIFSGPQVRCLVDVCVGTGLQNT